MAEIVSVVASTHNPRIFWNRDQAAPEDMNELYATFSRSVSTNAHDADGKTIQHTAARNNPVTPKPSQQRKYVRGMSPHHTNKPRRSCGLYQSKPATNPARNGR